MTLQLNIDHSEKSRAEVFLRSLHEKFETLPFDWKSLKESRRIVDAVKVTNTNKTLVITILFLNTFSDADLIANANAIKKTVRWGCNGSLMYLVESADLEKGDQVLGTFAG